ncbi:diacylglycerol-binding protein [Nocardioides marmorisolisilvae]|uniref:Uncharacterized protein n=1 Tax=Nocardioides marmorisolisilvae TaxID=1542737 RepID=A0A3N0DPV1_9ACTN|nr:hypothetical protein [Nocardioides marmorisolisilvae]RNL77677.1 hypothetical protein EFL95_16865 [Nocardioides marmorisolisilvae]
MKLRLPVLGALFLLGAAASLLGDHFHVSTLTTAYLDRAHDVPFLWDSPIWFPVLVGAGTAGLADLRLRLGAPRTSVEPRYAVGGIAAVLGSYAFTTALGGFPDAVSVTLIAAPAVLVWCFIGDRFAVVCGVLAAVVGPAIEIALVKADVFKYSPDSDSLFGVGPWLPPLYFGFGVVASVLGELAVRRPPAATQGQPART